MTTDCNGFARELREYEARRLAGASAHDDDMITAAASLFEHAATCDACATRLATSSKHISDQLEAARSDSRISEIATSFAARVASERAALQFQRERAALEGLVERIRTEARGIASGSARFLEFVAQPSSPMRRVALRGEKHVLLDAAVPDDCGWMPTGKWQRGKETIELILVPDPRVSHQERMVPRACFYTARGELVGLNPSKIVDRREGRVVFRVWEAGVDESAEDTLSQPLRGIIWFVRP